MQKYLELEEIKTSFFFRFNFLGRGYTGPLVNPEHGLSGI